MDRKISTTGGLSINGATVFNESGADVDFRIEGDTLANLFYVDASNDRIGIGTSSPATLLHDRKLIQHLELNEVMGRQW